MRALLWVALRCRPPWHAWARGETFICGASADTGKGAKAQSGEPHEADRCPSCDQLADQYYGDT